MNIIETATTISFKNILFLTDLTEASQAAFLYALAFTRHYSAQMYPAHIVVSASAADPKQSRVPEIPGLGTPQSEQLIELVKDAGVRYQPLVCVDTIENAVRRWINEYGIDLIVLGTHGRRGVQRFLLGSTAGMILRTASCPVLTVGPHVLHRLDADAAISKILFATGMTAPSSVAISYALSLAREKHAHLTALRIIPENTSSYNPARQRATAYTQLRRLIPLDAEVGCEPQFIVEVGDVEEHVLNYAHRDLPDLIVLALPRNNGFSTLDAGVTYKIISASPSAVLAVPEKL